MSPEEEQNAQDRVGRVLYATDSFMDLAKELVDEGLEPSLVFTCMLSAFWSFITNVCYARMDFNSFNQAKAVNKIFEEITKELIANHITNEATLRGRTGNA